MSKNKDLDNLDLYSNDIRNIKVLTKEEEIELFKKYKNGDISARNELITSNLKLIRSIALKYKKLNISFEDLLQDAVFDLIAAIDNFSLEKGYKFSTYAHSCLSFRIKEYVDKQCRPFGFSRKEANIYSKVKNSYFNFAVLNGRFPTLEEISNITDIKESKIIELYSSLDYISLNGVIDDNYYECMEQDDFEYEDIYKVSNYVMDVNVNLEEEICSKIDYELLKKTIIENKNLTETERRNIICLFGLEDGIEKTETEVASIYDVSNAAIWFSLKSAFNKLSNSAKVRSFK